MFTGRISKSWAKMHAKAWLSEVEASEIRSHVAPEDATRGGSPL